MTFDSPSRLRQFSLRTLLAVVALAAITIVIGRVAYRSLVPQPFHSAFVRMKVDATPPQSDSATATRFVNNLDANTLSEWLLADPGFNDIPTIKTKADPKSWLIRHLDVNRKMAEFSTDMANVIDLRFNVDASTISESDLRSMLDKSVEVFQAKARESDLRATLLDRQWFIAYGQTRRRRPTQ